MLGTISHILLKQGCYITRLEVNHENKIGSIAESIYIQRNYTLTIVF